MRSLFKLQLLKKLVSLILYVKYLRMNVIFKHDQKEKRISYCVTKTNLHKLMRSLKQKLYLYRICTNVYV